MLREELETLEGDTYGEFEKKFTNVLNTHAPIKTEMINKNVFMTKELRKYIMKRSKQRNNFMKIGIMKIVAILKFRGTPV